jgi:hypothetical protein
MSLYFGFNNKISDYDNQLPSIHSWLLKKIESDNCEGIKYLSNYPSNYLSNYLNRLS